MPTTAPIRSPDTGRFVACSPIVRATIAAIGDQYSLDDDDRAQLAELIDPDDDDQSVDVAGMSLRIMTDDGLETAWDDSLQSYLDDCVLPDLPEMARTYFDEDAWKRDARFDGWAHSLNYYDGVGIEACARIGATTEWRFIVRTN